MASFVNIIILHGNNIPFIFGCLPWFIMAILTLTLIVALDMEIALIHSLVVSTFIPVTKGVMVLSEIVGN